MTPGSSCYSDQFSDHQLGHELGALIAQQASSNLPYSIIFGQLQDLLGDDTALLGPLRDLLGRPAFQQMAGFTRHSVQIGARDALLQDLAQTYNSVTVVRLAAVLDGCLGLPSTPVSATVQQHSTVCPPTSLPQSTSQSFHLTPDPITPINQNRFATHQHQSINSTARNAGSSFLIALVALLSGAVLVGLAWLFSGNRLQQTTTSEPSPKAPLSDPEPKVEPDNPVAPATPNELNAPVQGAWGSSSAYKFGQLPGGDYPQSCAFSSTDPGGRFNTDKSQLEFWACRDDGGDATNGYKVAWADGKETTYTFGANGIGEVVGTNGNRYPMRWRNDNHNGDSIIVINHQDGAITWIPGNVR